MDRTSSLSFNVIYMPTATVNMRPDLFKVATMDVPFVDVLCTMCDSTVPLTAVEWDEW